TFGFDRTQYWIHSLGAACCARALAAAKRLGDPEDAFLAALLHDFGKMVLDEHLPSEYQQAVRIANVGREPVRRGEAATFEVDHTYVGERIADHWDLPDYLCRAIADHHKHALLLKKQQTDVSGKDDSAGIVRCVCLADQLAKAFGFGHAGDHIVERDALALWRGVNAVPGGFPAFYARVREELCKFLGLLQIPLGVRAEEPRVERVLLCFPEDEPEYRMLLEAFWARYGYPTVRQATLNDAPVEGPEMVTGVTHVSGSLEDVARAADTLGRLARTGMVIADGLEGNHEGKMVTGSVRAVGPALDFYVLNRWRRAVSAAHSPSPVNSDRGETALRPSDSSSEET
ncbi:MAG TPA: HDOD domain-containing protein, partial [Candidatus Hydrogenedentes bacterium]|nr:HDOD domain-containing protein [Candidatus Hydrogenedentota bacterium]